MCGELLGASVMSAVAEVRSIAPKVWTTPTAFVCFDTESSFGDGLASPLRLARRSWGRGRAGVAGAPPRAALLPSWRGHTLLRPLGHAACGFSARAPSPLVVGPLYKALAGNFMLSVDLGPSGRGHHNTLRASPRPLKTSPHTDARLAGLWPFVTTKGCVAGLVAGVFYVVLWGWVEFGTFVAGFSNLTLMCFGVEGVASKGSSWVCLGGGCRKFRVGKRPSGKCPRDAPLELAFVLLRVRRLVFMIILLLLLFYYLFCLIVVVLLSSPFLSSLCPLHLS